MTSLAVAVLATLCLPDYTQAAIYDTRFDGTTWDDSNWRIITTDLDQGHYQSRMSLANGYLGINVANVGPFFEVDAPYQGGNVNGWPLFDRRQTFATIAGFYDEQPTTNGSNFPWLNQYGGESVISGVPHWSGLHLSIGDDILNASVPAEQISDFSSTLDMKAGTLGWNYTWTPSSGQAIQIEYLLFVHKLYVNQAAVQLKATSQQDVNATVIDVLDGDCAVRTDFVEKSYEPVFPMIWSAVKPVGIENVTAYIFSLLIGDDSCDTSSRSNYTIESVIGGNSSSIGQSLTVALKANQTSTVTKYIGGASSDAFDDPQSAALNGSWNGANQGFDALLASHTQEWQNILTEDSVDNYRYAENGTIPDDPNLIELQITSITNPFHLIQNTVGSNAILEAGNNTKLDVNSIAVGGLGSSSYAGHIFWDAEVWMAPGLVVSHPQAAKQIAGYRVEKFPQAQANVKTAFSSSKNQTNFSPNGAVFPWTSSRYGNCTGVGPCFDYEYHINGDIGLELYNYYAVTGDSDYFQSELYPIYEAVAQFYADLLTFNSSTGKYELYNATDPDEYTNYQDNVGYTLVLIKTHLENAELFRARFGQPLNATWDNISSLVTVPTSPSANIILEYGAMNNSVSVKQADVVLVDDFLDYPNPYSLSDLDYYAAKQSANGPGMTYGVFSIVANEISPSGCSSYTYMLYGSQPYTRGPWFQYSEQLLDDYDINGGTHPAYPFLTGMGGAHRVAVFGYLGLRLLVESLNVDPNLPPQIPQINYRTIYWQGWPVNATSNQTHTTLTRLGTPLANANSTFASASIPVTIGVDSSAGNGTTYSLAPNGTITLRNRQIGTIKTVPGNIAQCQSASSQQPYEIGQFPLSAVDGAVSTKWQPTQANISSSLTVELPEPFVQVSGFAFDWAQAPPTSYFITFSNSTDTSANVTVAASGSVDVSNPYDAATNDVIVPYQSNTTNVSLPAGGEVWSGRFATLTIAGNHANAGTANAANGTGATVAEWAIIAAGEGGNVARRAIRGWTG